MSLTSADRDTALLLANNLAILYVLSSKFIDLRLYIGIVICFASSVRVNCSCLYLCKKCVLPAHSAKCFVRFYTSAIRWIGGGRTHTSSESKSIYKKVWISFHTSTFGRDGRDGSTLVPSEIRIGCGTLSPVLPSAMQYDAGWNARKQPRHFAGLLRPDGSQHQVTTNVTSRDLLLMH
jgi:hypothetical protein